MSPTRANDDSPGAGKPWEHAKAGGSGADAMAAQFVQSLDFDTRLYRHDIAGSLAHARMLAHVKLITGDELNQIEQGLATIQSEIDDAGDDWPGWRIELEDVHMCIEAALIEKTGDAGRKLHTGRSRNDQVALDLKLWIHDAAGQLQGKFDTLFHAFVELAGRDGRIVMPSYTHLQRAQPIVVGSELMAWLCALDRAQRRVAALRTVNQRNPLGSGAIAGSSLPLDRDHTSGQLDAGSPTPNSIDATASRDAAVDFVFAMSMIAMNLSRWAEQWIVYATQEFGFVTLDDRYTTGSSMMPQKRNPDMLELIRGRCGDVYGRLVALLTLCKGLPIGYNRDLQEDKRHVFAAFDTVCDCMDMAARIVATARFNEERIAARLDEGFLDATSLAEYLVTRGVPFRTGHQIVGALVKRCLDDGVKRLCDLPLEALNDACEAAGAGRDVLDQAVYDSLGPANVVGRYTTTGNAGRTGFETQLEAWQSRLGA